MTIEIQRGGKIGVLLHEYQRAIAELKQSISGISDDELRTIVDRETANPGCVSIQSILAHMVACGNMYCVFIRNHRGEQLEIPKRVVLNSVGEYAVALDAMFLNTYTMFADIAEIEMDEYDPEKKIQVYWGQLYDFEQLMEHAIVHILRHRRQIEKFLVILRGV